EPVAQRLELSLLAAVVEVEDGDGRLDGLAGSRSLRPRRSFRTRGDDDGDDQERAETRGAGHASILRPPTGACQERPRPGGPSLTPHATGRDNRAMAVLALVVSAALCAA